MRRLVSAAFVLAALLTASPASAITDGSPDGNRHPNVAGLVNDTQYSDGTWIYCSGTLISPTVVLTAAHCNDDGARTRVTFDSAYVEGDRVYAGTFHSDPLYPGPTSDYHDIAVVVLDEPIKGRDPARLPTRNRLEDLPKGKRFTSVGYGSQEVSNAPGGHEFVYKDAREYSVGKLNSATKSYLRISQNPATGNGGTCYGDSGGPNFLGAGASETDIVASTTITGDAYCKSTNVTYRLDTRSARAFLKGYVRLP